MKKYFTLLALSVLLFTSYGLKATHYMGGEITWECLSNGNYRFILKAYRECYASAGSSAVNYVTSQIIYSNSTVPNITLTVLAGYPKDISPECNSNTNYTHITCVGMSNGVANMGAVQEWVFTSDSIYPNGVYLTGTPPASGWSFYWGSCCRNPSTNIVNSNSKSWRLRAIMYPYGTQNAFPCFDNAPVFAEKPRTVVTTGSFSFNDLAFDEDMDSLSYSWGQPLLSTGSPITSYAAGYGYQSPLPGTSVNPNNIAATLDPISGQIKATSYTTGAFVTSVKVTSYRFGVKISEIWRDIQVVIGSGSSNNPPVFPPPFLKGTSFDTVVFVGDTVSFQISAIDFQFLPNGSAQNVGISFFGQQLGEFIPPMGVNLPTLSNTTGCISPPCATLTPASNPSYPLIGMFGIASQFRWLTSCGNLDVMQGGHRDSLTYHFLITAYDDYCPIPGISHQILNITVKDRPKLTAPNNINVVFDYDSLDAVISWNAVADPLNQFDGYYVYYSQNLNSLPYTLVDSVININTTSIRVHTGAINYGYFLLKVKSHNTCQSDLLSSSQVYNLNLTGISNDNNTGGFTVLPARPNPASHSVTLSYLMDNPAKVHLDLTDLSGRLLQSHEILSKKGENNFVVDLSGLRNGIYYYAIELNGVKKTGKVVVLKR